MLDAPSLSIMIGDKGTVVASNFHKAAVEDYEIAAAMVSEAESSDDIPKKRFISLMLKLQN